MEKIYIAYALVLDNENKVKQEIFCGAFFSRPNAYKNIQAMMEMSGDAKYIPQVRIAEVLDSDNNDPATWNIHHIDNLTIESSPIKLEDTESKV